MMGPHDWDQSYLHDRPIGKGEDVSTWDVHPGAIDMKKLYVMMTDYWKFDEKLHQITCDLNAENMAKFMREFRWMPRASAPGERRQGPPVQKAMGYVARNILRVTLGVPTRSNDGPRWWLDPKAGRHAPTAMSKQWQGT